MMRQEKLMNDCFWQGRAEDSESGTNRLVAGVSSIRQDRIETMGFTMKAGFATIASSHQAVLRSKRVT